MKKRLITFIRVMRQTRAHKVMVTYLIFVYIAAWIILLTEPGITKYGDALWYCYDVISTTGFGDVVVRGFVARMLSVAVTVYSLIVVAIMTGVFSNFYMLVIEEEQNGTIDAFLDKLERLPELSKEELAELSEKVKKYKNKL